MWCIPQADAAFVAAMEEVLEIYEQPYDPREPKVCFDETNKQLIAETRTPLPIQPGRVARHDHEYQRNGTRNLFLFFEPLRGWRHLEVTERRTAQDFAGCIQWLVDVAYPDARLIHLIVDNLNTHRAASLYASFTPQEARRLLRKVVFHYTPKHGSWLNMAEIEFSVLARLCLDRRIPDEATLKREVTAFEAERNARQATVDWQFTTADARIKLKHLYPSISY